MSAVELCTERLTTHCEPGRVWTECLDCGWSRNDPEACRSAAHMTVVRQHHCPEGHRA